MKFITAYLVLYAATLALLVRFEGFEYIEPLFALVLMGGGFSLVAWLLTRGRPVAPLPAMRNERGILPYLLPVAAFVTWGLGAIPSEQPLHDVVSMLTKLIVFVALPWALFDRARPRPRMSAGDWRTTVAMSAILILFQLAFGRGPHVIAEANLSTGRLAMALVFAFVWLAIEVGLVEEYLFRGLLQTRLETLTRSTAGGIVFTALLFGLIHAPGLYLRPGRTGEGLGGSPSLLMAIGYSIVMLSPSGLFFGVLWSRTRNLAVVVTIHAMGDLIPNVIDLAHNFGIR